MAELIPCTDLAGPVPPHKRGELKTARLLQQYLPDYYKVFHSVYWATQDDSKTFFGEIDFIVMSPLGRLLLIEQKNGPLLEKNGGLLKMYRQGPKDIQSQLNRGAGNLKQAFEARCGGRLDMDLLIYCPEHVVENKAIAGIIADQIVDQPIASGLPDKILSIMSARAPHEGVCTDVDVIEKFLGNTLNIRHDIGFLGELAKTAYVEQAAGLSEWVGSLYGTPFRLLVDATAGSGKTQLALDEVRGAIQAGQSALYVCFNRNLAVDMKLATGQPETSTTFHELARVIYEAQGFQFSGSVQDFEKSSRYFIDHVDRLASSLDVLVIDEAQDFEAEWLDALFKLCRPAGRLIVLKDSNQCLYSRNQHVFDGWMRLDHQVSYRCPQLVVDCINELKLTPVPLLSRSVVEGLSTLLETYVSGNRDSLEQATGRVVSSLLAQGHSAEDIALLTLRGAENSLLLQLDSIAGHSLRKVVGRNAEGDFEYSEGDLFADTVFRFKGRSANCVVLTEIDFDDLNENTRRRLFVGISRARLRVAFVLTEKAAALLAENAAN